MIQSAPSLTQRMRSPWRARVSIKELEARSLFLLGWIHVRQGDYEEGVRYVEGALDLYALLVVEPTASQELQLPSFAIGAPLTQSLTNQATEAACWATLAIAQVNVGQAQDSIGSGRRALALAKEIKNVWVEVSSTNCLTNGLLEVGAYEESLTLMQHTMALARILPSMQVLLSYLHTLGRTYHTLQQWEAAQNSLEEAVAVAETLNLGYLRVPALSQMCMRYAVVGDWEQAYRYALKASAIRNSSDLGLHPLDYYLHFETEAFLHEGDERKAREDVKRLGERLGPICAPAFPIFEHWRSWPNGKGTAIRPLITCVVRRRWRQTSAYQRNSGRSRRR